MTIEERVLQGCSTNTKSDDFSPFDVTPKQSNVSEEVKFINDMPHGLGDFLDSLLDGDEVKFKGYSLQPKPNKGDQVREKGFQQNEFSDEPESLQANKAQAGGGEGIDSSPNSSKGANDEQRNKGAILPDGIEESLNSLVNEEVPVLPPGTENFLSFLFGEKKPLNIKDEQKKPNGESSLNLNSFLVPTNTRRIGEHESNNNKDNRSVTNKDICKKM